MEYSKIIAVSGMPGLYELLTSKADGAIVRSLDDKTTKFVSSRVHNFSHLESIEIFTVRENVNLIDILNAIKNSSEKLPDEKDNNGLKPYFQKVYPDLDFDRVYSSDLKKMIKWYTVLTKNNIDFKLTEAPEETVEEEKEEPVVVETVAEEKPKAKKAPAKKKVELPEEPAKKAPSAEKKTTDKKTAEKPKAKEEKPAVKKAPAKKKSGK